jgi:hypothetical protein
MRTTRREQPGDRVVVAKRGRRPEQADRGESQAAERRSNQEVQSDLVLMRARGVKIPAAVLHHADRLGGLIYGLLRAELRDAGR